MSTQAVGGAIVGRRGRYEAGPDLAWELIETPPAPELAGIVKRYVGFVERSPAQPHSRLETPGVSAKLIFNFGAPLAVQALGGPRRSLRRSFFVRFSTLPATTEFEGLSAGIEVDVTPVGAASLLNQPMHEAPDPVSELELLIGPVVDLMTERLADATRWDERFGLLDDFLLRQLADAVRPPPMIEWAWGRLVASGGNAAIADMAREIGCSPAYLSRTFRRHIGLTPKTTGAVLRFNRVDHLLARRAEPISLAELAATCGYHDQSHMTREFRRFTGTTPAAYAEALRPDFLGVPAD